MKEVLTRQRFFQASSRLTDHFPRYGARALNTLVGAAVGNPLLLAHEAAGARAALHRAAALDRLLVVADLNIGDAVMMQAAIAAIRDFLPDAEIDYAISRLARPLIQGAAENATLRPIFGSGLPEPRDARAVRRLAEARGYDVIFNFCHFFNPRALAPTGMPVVPADALALMLMRTRRSSNAVAHITFQAYRFVHQLLGGLLAPTRTGPFSGVAVHLSTRAAERAADFLDRRHGGPEPLVMLNPDASSRFTRPPLDLQVSLLKRLLSLPVTVILGAGHTWPGIEQRLLTSLRPTQRDRVRVLPASMPLDGYTALTDACDIFITGDTGPLHLAAARKEGGGRAVAWRNRTAIVSIFGATPVRVYGYASGRPGFLPANQRAPSFAHVAPSPCRNLTCIHKHAKRCRAVRCFEHLDVENVLADVRRVLSGASSPVDAE